MQSHKLSLVLSQSEKPSLHPALITAVFLQGDRPLIKRSWQQSRNRLVGSSSASEGQEGLEGLVGSLSATQSWICFPCILASRIAASPAVHVTSCHPFHLCYGLGDAQLLPKVTTPNTDISSGTASSAACLMLHQSLGQQQQGYNMVLFQAHSLQQP